MELRLLTRTHYQIDEPAYIRDVVLRCTSAVKTDYSEAIAGRLKAFYGAQKLNLNLPAAGYAVDLARALHVLTENNNWSEFGHLVALCSTSRGVEDSVGNWFDLSTKERILYFRLFLEFDGAAFLYFCRLLVNKSEWLSNNDWANVANDLFESVYREYLNLASDIRDRTKIRQALNKRIATPYSGKSGPHQVFLHLQTLLQIGLVSSDTGLKSRRYVENRATREFLRHVPDIARLEDIISTRRWPELAKKIFFKDQPIPTSRRDEGSLIKMLKDIYSRVVHTGVTLCPLTTMVEAIQIGELASGMEVTRYDDIISVVKACQRIYPRSIRFHVDRMGRPAFLVFDKDFLAAVE